MNISSQSAILQTFVTQMKIKSADNSEDFFESLHDLKDLVDLNC